MSVAGATLRQYRKEVPVSADPMVAAFCSTCKPLHEDLQTLQPRADILIYDPFDPIPQVVGQALAIPAVAMVLNTGPGSSAPWETDANTQAFQVVRKWVQEEYSVDLFDFGIPMVSWYSRTLNLVLTCEEFYEGPVDDKQRDKFGHLPFTCVGSLVDPRTCRRPSVQDFPLHAFQTERDGGKKVVLLSLGSAVTGLLWERLLPGGAVGNDDGTQSNGKTLGQMTGKEVAHYIWGTAFEALGSSEDLLVVVTVGGREDALGSLVLPPNFHAFSHVPQLEFLPLCDAFITHGGMGSTMESLVFRVPMVVIPVFGDQSANADNVAKSNVGVSFRYPLKTLTPAGLGASVRGILDGSTPFKAGLETAATKMESAGGSAKAIELILAAMK